MRKTGIKKAKSQSHKHVQKKQIKKRIRQAQPIHKRFILHPLTILCLLSIGVFLGSWTYRVIADNVTVSAILPAPPLTEGATITSPLNNTTFSVSSIEVQGLCPDDSYVKLYDNGLFSGVDVCSVGNTFTIPTDLFVGSNVLLAQDYNVTDLQGPVTATVTVLYTPIPSPSGSTPTTTVSTSGSTPSTTPNHKVSSSQSPTNSSQAAKPLIIVSDFHYQTFNVGARYTAQVRVEGGSPPYGLSVAWGDKQTTKQYVLTNPLATISHVYDKQGYYLITITATDSAGSVRTLQLAALIQQPASIGIVSNGHKVLAGSNPSIFSRIFNNSKAVLIISWIPLVIVTLMACTFWLGEKKEYQYIIRSKRIAALRKYARSRRKR